MAVIDWPGSGTGTVADPFLITNKSEYDFFANFSNSDSHAKDDTNSDNNFQLAADIDFAAGQHPRMTIFNAHLDMNGFSVLNVGSLASIDMIRDLNGSIFGSGIYDITHSKTGNLYIINEVKDGGLLEDIEFQGSLEASDGSNVHFINAINSGATANNLKFNGTLTTSGTASPIALIQGTTTVDYFLSVCTFAGGGTFAGLVTNATTNPPNSFWDTTIGPATSTAGTGKTTAELQDIDTYTNTATAGLDVAWDMAEEGSYVAELWVLQASSYPALAATVELTPPLTGTANVLGVATSGVTATFFQCDDVNLTNLTVLGTNTSDGSGNVSFTGAYDDTKHIGILWHLLEFDEADNPTVTGMIEWINGLDLTPPA